MGLGHSVETTTPKAKDEKLKLFCVLHNIFKTKLFLPIQARIAQLVAYRLGTGEFLGSNPGKARVFQ